MVMSPRAKVAKEQPRTVTSTVAKTFAEAVAEDVSKAFTSFSTGDGAEACVQRTGRVCNLLDPVQSASPHLKSGKRKAGSTAEAGRKKAKAPPRHQNGTFCKMQAVAAERPSDGSLFHALGRKASQKLADKTGLCSLPGRFCDGPGRDRWLDLAQVCHYRGTLLNGSECNA